MYYADGIKGDLYINIIYINIYEKEKHSSINTKFQAQMVVQDVPLKIHNLYYHCDMKCTKIFLKVVKV